MPVACVAVQVAAARRGKRRRSQREVGKRRDRCWGGTWRSLEQRGDGGGAAHGRSEQRRRRREETEEPGLEEEDEDWFVIYQKCRDLTIMSW
jgi:hypothetical protein